MRNWKEKSLAELTINHDTRRKPVKEAERIRGCYPYYGASGVIDWVKDYIFDGEYLLIAEDGENLKSRQLPVAFLARGKFWVNNHAHIVQGNDAADTKFLCYAINALDLSGFLTGAVMPKLTQANLNRIPILAPPIEEQKKIASVLSALDDKIELNRKQNATLEAIAQAIFKSWFVNFDPVKAKAEGRQPEGMDAATAALFPSRLVESDLGQIPDGWNGASLNAIAHFNPTETLRKGSEAPYLDMAALPTSGCWPDSPIQREFSSGTKFRNGDTLLARITPCLENGKTAYVMNLPPEAIGWGSTEFIVMRAKTREYSELIYLLARTSNFRAHAIQSMTGTSGRQRAQSEMVATYPLAIPSDDRIIAAFSNIATNFFRKIKENSLQNESLSALRDTLLPRLMSGKLRLVDNDTSSEAA